MLDLEQALLYKILETGDFDYIDSEGITSALITDTLLAHLFDKIQTHYHKAETKGETLSMRQAAYIYPSITAIPPPQENLKTLVRDLRNDYVCRRLGNLSHTINSLTIEGDARRAIAAIQEELKELERSTGSSRDLVLTEHYDRILKKYIIIRDHQGLTGIPWPWNPLNEETLGIQRGDYIIFSARPKSMKTWVLIYLAYHAYVNSGRRVLFYTREMSPEIILRRMVAMSGKVDYKSFIKARLTYEEEANVLRSIQNLKVEEQLQRASGNPRSLLQVTNLSDAGHGSGILGLSKKIKEMKPDLVCIDAIYLMPDDRAKKGTAEHTKHLHVSRDVRGLALDEQLPVVGTTQVNRAGADTKGTSSKEGAFTDAYMQDAEILARINLRRRKQDAVIILSGGRETNLDGFIINTRPAYDFSHKKGPLPPNYLKLLGYDPNEDEEDDPHEYKSTMDKPLQGKDRSDKQQQVSVNKASKAARIKFTI